MNRLLTSIICGLVTINAVAQTNPGRPRLVLGIVVDQLRTDYLEQLKDLFGETGFKRLMNNGLYLRNVDFGIKGLDRTNSTAILYTGSYPLVNGIPGEEIFDHSTRQRRPVMWDATQLGNFTSDTYSPSAIRVSTLGDEISVDGAGLASIYSVSPDASQSIIMSGHAGTSALWISDINGDWASTSYYKEPPRNLLNRNRLRPLSARIDTMVWTPLLPLESYPGLPGQKKYFPFKHFMSRKGRDAYRDFKRTPFVNAEVTDMALDCLKETNLGNRGDVIDMLNVGYVSNPYGFAQDGDDRLETEDAYVRLDRQIGRLLDAVDKQVGLENTLVFLSSTGYYERPATYEERYRIPNGRISIKRCLSLLNSFLSAKYGNGDYVEGYHNGAIYLNDKTLETQQLDEAEVDRSSRDFLSRMTGVAEVRTLREIQAAMSEETEILRRSIDPRLEGNVYLTFAPGWTVVDDSRAPVSEDTTVVCGMNSPLIILWPPVSHQVIDTPVDATAVAPTLSGSIRIRAPNASTSRPLLTN